MNKNILATEHQKNEQLTSNEVQETLNINHPESVELLGEQVKIKGIAIPSSEVNKDFDNMVEDATKTIEQTATDKRELKEEKPYTPEIAAGVALTGLSGVMKLVSKFTGTPLIVDRDTQMVFAAMCTPLVLKYGKTIKSLLNPENVDLNSNVPEYLALAAFGVVAVPSYLQVKAHNKQLALNEKSTTTESKKEVEAVESDGS
jgi:hypothetical protein